MSNHCAHRVPQHFPLGFNLKALSVNGITGAVARALDFAQRYTLAIDFSDMDKAHHMLDLTHAFVRCERG